MNIQLRPWKYADGPALTRIADDADIAKNLRDVFPHPYTEENALQYISMCKNTPPTVLYNRCIIADGQVAGSIGLTFGSDILSHSAEIGYWIGKDFWSRGIATEAVRRICRTGFHSLGLHRITATVFAGNDASVKVLEKNGFLMEGIERDGGIKYGEYIDLIKYAKLTDR